MVMTTTKITKTSIDRCKSKPWMTVMFLCFTEPVKIKVDPMHQKQKEGSRVEFKCIVQGKSEVFYQWIKDGTEMPGQNDSTLVLSSVELRDFGCYVCQVSFADSQCDCRKSSAAMLDVVPRDGMGEFCCCTEWSVIEGPKMGSEDGRGDPAGSSKIFAVELRAPQFYCLETQLQNVHPWSKMFVQSPESCFSLFCFVLFCLLVGCLLLFRGGGGGKDKALVMPLPVSDPRFHVTPLFGLR